MGGNLTTEALLQLAEETCTYEQQVELRKQIELQELLLGYRLGQQQ